MMRHLAGFRMLWCAAGAALAMGLALTIAGPGEAPFLLAGLLGSTVCLFGLPDGVARPFAAGHFMGRMECLAA